MLQTLSVVLNTAKPWGYMTEGMSMKGLSPPPHRVRTTARFLTADKARRIITTASEPHAASVLGFLDPDGPTAEDRGTMIQ